jgi:hypothetical protein
LNHIGYKGTSFQLHRDVGGNAAISFVHEGRKEVFVIEEQDIEKLDALLAQYVSYLAASLGLRSCLRMVKEDDCHARLNHNRVFISPSILEANGIRFHRVCL